MEQSPSLGMWAERVYLLPLPGAGSDGNSYESRPCARQVLVCSLCAQHVLDTRALGTQRPGGEMAQQLRALAALTEDPGVVPLRTHGLGTKPGARSLQYRLGEMAQWIEVLPKDPKDRSLVPGTQEEGW